MHCSASTPLASAISWTRSVRKVSSVSMKSDGLEEVAEHEHEEKEDKEKEEHGYYSDGGQSDNDRKKDSGDDDEEES